jgi:hypothetical protein
MVDQVRVEMRSIYDVVFLPGEDRKYHVADDNGSVLCGAPTADLWCKEFCPVCYSHVSDPDVYRHGRLRFDCLIIVGLQASPDKPCVRVSQSPFRSGHNVFLWDDRPRSLPFYLPANWE